MLTDKKRENKNNTTIVEDLNNPLTSIGRSSRQKISKAIVVSNNTIDQLDFIDVYRTLHPITAEYKFYASAHRTFSKIANNLGHKTSLNKFEKIEIISRIFSNHNGMKPEFNYRKKNGKRTNKCRLNNMLLKNQ